MKEIKVEKTISEVKYQAADGEIFVKEKDCVEYENTLKCIMKAKYNKLVVKHIKEYEIASFGSEDYYVDVVKLKSKEDVETIVHLLNAYSQRSSEEIEKLMDNLDKIRKDKEDCLLLYAGSEYDGPWYSYLGSAKEFLEKAKNSIFNTSKEETK